MVGVTEQQTPPQPALIVDLAAAASDDRLAALYAAYPAAKAKKDAAEAELKAITDGIKLELTSRAPEGTQRLELRGPDSLCGAPLALRWQVSYRFDTKAFINASPANAAVYESFKKPSGTWVLAPIKAGE